jgi:hypothetical protein
MWVRRQLGSDLFVSRVGAQHCDQNIPPCQRTVHISHPPSPPSLSLTPTLYVHPRPRGSVAKNHNRWPLPAPSLPLPPHHRPSPPQPWQHHAYADSVATPFHARPSQSGTSPPRHRAHPRPAIQPWRLRPQGAPTSSSAHWRPPPPRRPLYHASPQPTKPTTSRPCWRVLRSPPPRGSTGGLGRPSIILPLLPIPLPLLVPGDVRQVRSGAHDVRIASRDTPTYE